MSKKVLQVEAKTTPVGNNSWKMPQVENNWVINLEDS